MSGIGVSSITDAAIAAAAGANVSVGGATSGCGCERKGSVRIGERGATTVFTTVAIVPLGGVTKLEPAALTGPCTGIMASAPPTSVLLMVLPMAVITFIADALLRSVTKRPMALGINQVSAPIARIWETSTPA